MILTAAAESGKTIEVLWPWEFISPEELLELDEKAGEEIFGRCVSNLESADMVIALLDGPQVDDGTAWEVGCFFRHRAGSDKRVIGIRTDFRNAGDTKFSLLNSMVEHSCDRIVHSREEVVQALAL